MPQRPTNPGRYRTTVTLLEKTRVQLPSGEIQEVWTAYPITREGWFRPKQLTERDIANQVQFVFSHELQVRDYDEPVIDRDNWRVEINGKVYAIFSIQRPDDIPHTLDIQLNELTGVAPP